MTRRDLIDDVLSSPEDPLGPLTGARGDDDDEGATADLPADTDGDELLEALGDAVSRDILRLCKRSPTTAEELAEECAVSESTIYRRLDTLSRLGLVTRSQRMNAPSKTSYETAIDGLSVHVEDTLRVEPGANDYVVDAMRTVLAAIDVEYLTFDRAENTVDVRFEVSPQLLDTLVELYVRDTASRDR